LASMSFDPELHHCHGGRAGTPSAVANTISARITSLTRALASKGVIATAYSPHDLRNASAEANASKGLMGLKERIGHTTIGVTEHYLRNASRRNIPGL